MKKVREDIILWLCMLYTILLPLVTINFIFKYNLLLFIITLIVNIVSIITVFTCYIVWKKRKNKKMKIDDFVICHSWASSVFLILMSMILLITLSVMNYLYSFDLSVNIIISIMIILSLFGSYDSVRQRIVIQKDKISVYPLFGKVKLYTFNDIKQIKKVFWTHGIVTYSIYGKKKLFSLDNSMVGYDLFLKKLEEKNFQNFKEL